MASVLRFRTVWGISPGNHYENWAKWFPTLKAKGYGKFSAKRNHPDTLSLTSLCALSAGVEVDFTDLSDLPSIRRLADEAGLEISVL